MSLFLPGKDPATQPTVPRVAIQFCPADERQIHLLEYMFEFFEHVSFEHVCSGIGIAHIYAYLRDVEHLVEEPEVAELIESTVDPSFVIINEAVAPDHQSPLCAATIDCLVSSWHLETGNLALKFLATGGVYSWQVVWLHTLCR